MIILFNFFFTFQTNETFGLYDDDVEDDDNALFLKVLMRGNPHTCLYFMFIFFVIISYNYVLWLYRSILFVAKGKYLYPKTLADFSVFLSLLYRYHLFFNRLYS